MSTAIMAQQTPQEAIAALLKKSGIPAKEIKVYAVNVREIVSADCLAVGSHFRIYNRLTAASGKILKINRVNVKVEVQYFDRAIRYEIKASEMIGGQIWEMETFPC